MNVAPSSEDMAWLASFRKVAIAILLVMLVGALLSRYLTLGTLSWYYFSRQDAWLVPAIVVVIWLLPFSYRSPQQSPSSRKALVDNPALILAVAASIFLVGWAGHHVVLMGYDLSRDEQMANFDARIFAHGRFYWPLPESWQGQARALNTMFMWEASEPTGWVSAYLPVNAMARAAVGMIADPAITSGLFTAIGFVALWRIALTLWPHDQMARVASLALYVGSSQVLVNAMTAYAMAGYLALNLIWLMLYLRGRPVADLTALLIGFAASGLHQVIFHPLFAGPFVLLLALQGKWRRFAIYVLGYLAIAAFWFAWPLWMSGMIASGPTDPASVDTIDRAIGLLAAIEPSAIGFTALNLMRFVAWQHLAFLPLVAAGVGLAWRGDAIARTLLLTIVATFAVIGLLLAYQGHGWGYRYAHGIIGSVCLLGGYGICELRRHGLCAGGFVAWTTAASLALAFALHLWMAHGMIAPFARIDDAIAASDADFALIDDRSAPFAADLAINPPDLGDRPIRLLASQVVPGHGWDRLCRGRRVAIFAKAELASIRAMFGVKPTTAADDRLLQRANTILTDAGCDIEGAR